MSALEYDGPGPSLDRDIVDLGYDATLLANNLSQAQVDALITPALTPYCPKTYVDQQDLLNANQAYVDGTGGVNPNGGDAARLHLSQINANSGVAGLDANGRVQASRLKIASTQRYPKAWWSPSSYNNSAVSVTTESLLYTCPVSDPSAGAPYRLMVFGMVDAKSSVDGEGPIVNVRIGSTTGPIIAQGRGCTESYQWGVDNFPVANGVSLGNMWAQSYFGGAGGSGTMIVSSPGVATWNKTGAGGNIAWGCTARRVYPADAVTLGDYQQVRYVVGGAGEAGGLIDADPSNNMFGRMSNDGQTYVQCRTTPSNVELYYSINGSGASLAGPVAVTQAAGSVYDFYCGYGSNLQTYQVNFNGTPVLSFTDTGGVTAIGAAYRGWGIGMVASQTTLLFIPIGQHAPGWVSSAQIIDPANVASNDNNNYGSVPVMPLPLSAQTAQSGAITLYVTAMRSGSSATITASPVRPSLSVMAVPA